MHSFQQKQNSSRLAKLPYYIVRYYIERTSYKTILIFQVFLLYEHNKWLRSLLGFSQIDMSRIFALFRPLSFFHSAERKNELNLLTNVHVILQLQVPDEALSFVMSMGFKERDVKRALRMNNQDVGGAIDFLDEEKAKKIRKREENIQRRNEIKYVTLCLLTSILYDISQLRNSITVSPLTGTSQKIMQGAKALWIDPFKESCRYGEVEGFGLF